MGNAPLCQQERHQISDNCGPNPMAINQAMMTGIDLRSWIPAVEPATVQIFEVVHADVSQP